LASHQATTFVNAASFLGVKCNERSEYDGLVEMVARKQSDVGEDRRSVEEKVNLPRKEAFVCAEPRMSPFHKCMEDFVSGSAGGLERVRATKVRDEIVPMLEKTHLSYDHLPWSQSEAKVGDGLLDRILKSIDKVGIMEALQVRRVGGGGGEAQVDSSVILSRSQHHHS